MSPVAAQLRLLLHAPRKEALPARPGMAWHGMERPGAGASKHRSPGAFKLQHPVDSPSHASCEFGKGGLVVSGLFSSPLHPVFAR